MAEDSPDPTPTGFHAAPGATEWWVLTGGDHRYPVAGWFTTTDPNLVLPAIISPDATGLAPAPDTLPGKAPWLTHVSELDVCGCYGGPTRTEAAPICDECGGYVVP